MHKILLPKWKSIFRILNFFSLHFQLRPQFYVGRSSWEAWNVSAICLGMVDLIACVITTQSCITPFAYLLRFLKSPLSEHNLLRMADRIGHCFLPRSSLITSAAAADGLPIGLCTFNSCQACTNKFPSRLFRKLLYEIFLPLMGKKRM